MTFGASDVADLTQPVLVALNECRPNSMPITAVTGGAYRHLARLEGWLQGEARIIKHFHDLSNMCVVYEKAKMAISAAGSTAYELAAMGVPSVLVVVADNQLNTALEQQQKGWCEVIDAREECSADRIVQVALKVWNNLPRLQAMHQHAHRAIVVNGAERAATEIVGCLG